jgi:hypothetical protein
MKRFEVPGWLWIALMTICLLVAIWAVARDQLSTWVAFLE